MALPFLLENHEEYLSKVFAFGRRTGIYETIGHQILINEKTFASKEFPLYITGLLAFLNLFFLLFKWTNIRTFFKDIRVIPFFNI
jgi:hypothetical protein